MRHRRIRPAFLALALTEMPFGRVEVIDARGRKAWTNALWIGA